MRKSLFRLGIVLFASLIGFAVRGCSIFSWPVTVTSLSPDDQFRVTVVELPKWIDRNFEVRLEKFGSRQVRTLFSSPDEGGPIGSERLVWSVDGSCFLLLGRHFYISDKGKLAGGDQAYLMVDVLSGQVWCNARQQRHYPEFGIAELQAVRWLGWAPQAASEVSPKED